jgi:hypothetical protein
MEQTTNFINKEIEKTERYLRSLKNERKKYTDEAVCDYDKMKAVDREIRAYEDMVQTLRGILNVMSMTNNH